MQNVVRLTDLGLDSQDLTQIGKMQETGLSPEQIAYNIKYGVHDITKNDNTNANINVALVRKEWMNILPAFTGIIAIEFKSLYDSSNIEGIYNIQLIEADNNKNAKNIGIYAKWNVISHSWEIGTAIDYNSLESIEIKFAKDTTNKKAYILLGNSDTVWLSTKVRIDMSLGSIENTLYSLDFNFSSLSTIGDIVTDITKNTDTLVNNSTLGTYEDFINGLEN